MMRILVVDDEQLIADSLYYFLLRKDMPEVYRAYGIQQALEILQSGNFGILLTDICMPEGDGFALVEKVRALWPEIRIIFLTGYDSFDYAYRAFQYEGVSFILKTDGYDVIWQHIERAQRDIEETRRIRGQIQAYHYTKAALVRQDLIMRMISGDASLASPEELLGAMPDMRPDEGVFLVCARFLSHGRNARDAVEEATQMHFEEDYVAYYALSDTALYILLQPKRGKERAGAFARVYLEAKLETVQQYLADKFEKPVSIVYTGAPAPWRELSAIAADMRKTLQREGEGFPALIMHSAGQTGSASWSVTFVADYINAHLEEDLTLLSLADIAHLNASYLSRLFHRQMGVRLHDYVNNARLEKACALLEETPYKVQDIAMRCGYGSPKYFSRLFREKYQKTPNEWREERIKKSMQ